MEKKKAIRKIVLAAVITAVVSAAVMAGIVLLGASQTSTRSIDLGDQNMDTKDYSAAIVNYTKALSIDPTNHAAVCGLARAYSASGDTSRALSVLDEYAPGDVGTDTTDVRVEILSARKQLRQAIMALETQIVQTDEQTYYDQQAALLTQLYAEGHPYAAGTDHAVRISGGAVETSGSNLNGQLGTAAGLGDANAAPAAFAAAECPAVPARVYAGPQASYVIDAAGNVFCAGSNRSGQMAQAASTAINKAGWTQLALPAGKAAAAVAGGQTFTLLLMQDGTVETCGQGFTAAGSWNPQPVRVPDFERVMQIGAGGNIGAVLTAGGALYAAQPGVQDGWTRYASDVVMFSLSPDGRTLQWLTADGAIHSTDGDWLVPEDWDAAAVTAAVSSPDGCLAEKMDGTVCWLQGGAAQELTLSGTVQDLYAAGSAGVILYEDGSSQYVDLKTGKFLQ